MRIRGRLAEAALAGALTCLLACCLTGIGAAQVAGQANAGYQTEQQRRAAEAAVEARRQRDIADQQEARADQAAAEAERQRSLAAEQREITIVISHGKRISTDYTDVNQCNLWM